MFIVHVPSFLHIHRANFCRPYLSADEGSILGLHIQDEVLLHRDKVVIVDQASAMIYHRLLAFHNVMYVIRPE